LDRRINYPSQVLTDTELLAMQRNTVVGFGWLARAILGTSTIVDGLTVGANSPAALNVVVQPGAIYTNTVVDQTAYGTLGNDTTHALVKQGIIQDATTLGITPPATSGYSQVYLIQAQFQEVDEGSVVLPYYNASNPTVPYSGPSNSGTAQYTQRNGKVALQAKAGVPATTGTQVAPSADAGWTGLATVTVANGATSITSGNITALSVLRPGSFLSITGGIATDLAIAAANAVLTIKKAASGGYNAIAGMQGSVLHWQQVLGSSGATSGGNAGSDASLQAYSDTGVFLGNVMAHTRSTLKTDFAVMPSVSGTDLMLNPVGLVAHFAATSAPTGWLKCNGAAVSRTTYAALFALLGTTWGSGDGSTTFNLPDLRGEFIRGLDDSRGIDTGRTLGTFQEATLLGASAAVGTFAAGNIVRGLSNGENTGAGTQSFGSYSTASSETFSTYRVRPRNQALLACIKF
jgi:microcystin-dependent protein